MASNGTQIHGDTVVPANSEVTVQIGGTRLAAIIVEVLDFDTTPVGADIDITVHPLNPHGDPYENGADELAVETATIASGKHLALVDLTSAPGIGFAVTIANTDTDDHTIGINALVNGE